MTAKEQRYVRKLEIKIEELEERLSKHFTIYRDNIYQSVETKCAAREALEAIEYAAECLRGVAS